MLNLEVEKKKWATYDHVCGVDEVGRGALAGPVVAAAVVFKKNFSIPKELKDVKDSKLLKPSTREYLDRYIRLYALFTSTAEVSAKRIDNINILNASFEAMNNAVKSLPQTPSYLLIDGNRFSSSLSIPYQTIIKGDLKVFSISAASIIAKVHRDRIMKTLAPLFPKYGLEKNVGYGVPYHRNAIKKHGTCVIHRQSFIHFDHLS